MTETRNKLALLKKLLLEMDRIVLAYSGGVDSYFLLAVALETLGPERVWR
jgi:uncharacterized protein